MSESTNFEYPHPPLNGVKVPGMITYDIIDKPTLYSAYMPFVKNGGLFILCNGDYHLGEELSLSLQLMAEPSRLSILGKVVWITPSHAQSNHAQGIGIQFNEEGSETIRNKIETYLAGALQSDRPTHTL